MRGLLRMLVPGEYTFRFCLIATVAFQLFLFFLKKDYRNWNVYQRMKKKKEERNRSSEPPEEKEK